MPSYSAETEAVPVAAAAINFPSAEIAPLGAVHVAAAVTSFVSFFAGPSWDVRLAEK